MSSTITTIIGGLNKMKIIDFKSLQMGQRIAHIDGQLREFPDYYEYCFIDDYEMKYDDFIIDGIQVDNIFVSILESRGKSMAVSLQFSKENDVYEIVEWLASHVVTFNESDTHGYFINQAHAIIEGVKFKGRPIVVASKGIEKIYYDPDDFQEVTDHYLNYSQIINTENAVDIEIDDVILEEKSNPANNGAKGKSSKPVKWIDDTDKDDWIDDWVNGKGYPGSEDDVKK